MKPHPSGVGAFASGELKKSYMTHGLNKGSRLSGGTHRSHSANKENPYHVLGNISPKDVGKTTIHYKVSVPDELGEKTIVKKAMSRGGYITKQDAFSAIPFVFKVVYTDMMGNTMTIENSNIR